MLTVPLIPDTAPFTGEQRAWLNGYFAGLFSRGPANAIAPAAAGNPPAAPAVAALKPLTVLFGSQTGTAEMLAKKAAKTAGRRGFAATVMDMAAFTPAQLAQEENILVIASTYGDGEPPDNAKTLHAALTTAPPPSSPASSVRPLARLRFSVCGLGDTNYAQFCQCAKDFDEHLEKRGATRIAPRADCDLDYEETFSTWLASALSALSGITPTAGVADAAGGADPGSVSASTSPLLADEPGAAATTARAPAPTRTNPFPSTVLAVRRLNAAHSAKEVNHVVFSLEGSGLVYEPGDALGVFPRNSDDLVAALLAALGCDGEEAVPAPDGATTSLRHALTAHYDLGKPSADFVACYHPPASDAVEGPVGATSGPATVSHHVLDLVLARPGTRLPPADFVRLLRKLQPRLYSIASSPRAHPGEVHLTVGAVRYEAHGRPRKGVCSTFLAEGCPIGSVVPIYVHSNSAFRLPTDPSRPVIMIGPGTGIAPFRAFLEERRASAAPGRTWLFFGDQHADSDFLYRDELAALQREGALTRLDLAFSRDQPEKIYVQHRMMDHAAELFAWLEAGAHLYVCGDASRMARDVDTALHRVIETAGARSPAQAADYVQALKAARRYARDVY
jgi:sulfite reductase (NADPH) flavoprotein alpha-component